MAVGLVMNSGMANDLPTNGSYDRSRFSLNLPITATAHHSSQSATSTSRLRHWDISPTDSSPLEPQPSNMLASPVMNMPMLCRYNPYSPAASVIQSMAASPSPNAYVGSPGDSSTYSASPINSPQQQFSSEDLMMRYGVRNHQQAAAMAAVGSPFQPRPPMPPTNEYGYYYNEYGLKRRKRDDELSPQEYEKRRIRRERNKQAALRCRTRRRERIDALEQETTQIEEDNEKVELEIRALKKQVEELQELLKEHECPKQLPYSGGNLGTSS